MVILIISCVFIRTFKKDDARKEIGSVSKNINATLTYALALLNHDSNTANRNKRKRLKTTPDPMYRQKPLQL